MQFKLALCSNKSYKREILQSEKGIIETHIESAAAFNTKPTGFPAPYPPWMEQTLMNLNVGDKT